jgi:transcriptional regulator NrdR family protein
MKPLTLHDPERCRVCEQRGKVIDSRVSPRGYRRRRHICLSCERRWTSYQSLIPFSMAAFGYMHTI